MIAVWLFILSIFFPHQHNAMAGDVSFLSFDSKEMISFDLSFKQYIASYKMYMEKDNGLKSLAAAIDKWDALIAKVVRQGTDEAILGRMTAIKGLLLQAQGLAHQGRFDEAKELSIPVRSELYALHDALEMLTPEDYMIFFHNGVMHRDEPLITERRYLELELLIPLIEDTVARFKSPPKGVADVEMYNKRYNVLVTKVQEYIAAIRQVNRYVDPEYGSYMLSKKIETAHNIAHKKFGAVYLSFPDGMIWPKKKK